MFNLKNNIPNIFTTLNLVSGFLGITFFLSDFTSLIPYCIYLSLIFDYLDGLTARKLNLISNFGKQLDSLADLVSFGVLPSLVIFDWLSNNSTYNMLEYISVLILVASAFRLAKFNISQSGSNDFIGLPTPVNALFFVSIFYSSKYATFLNDKILVGLVIIFSLLMISNIRFISMKFIDYSLAKNTNKYIIILVSLLCFLLLGIDGFPFIILFYISYSFFNVLFHRNNSK
ncbi:MAG TPA: CDP-diacylglycerol--serine O-phosphatidyltransferase [Cytophagales bacterium]|nr:CDP-diacylglycerol--serine O-phosphatidyltransferase [Cytophagales bacterium]